MGKFYRKPLEKENGIPKFKLIALVPIVAFPMLIIWFWGNVLACFICVIGLSVVEMALCLTDALLRKRKGGKFDRGDLMVFGAGAIAIVYMIYRIVKL